MTAPPLIVYRWRYRDELTGKMRTSRHRATVSEAIKQYGDRLISLVEDSREVRNGDGANMHMAQFQRSPRAK